MANSKTHSLFFHRLYDFSGELRAENGWFLNSVQEKCSNRNSLHFIDFIGRAIVKFLVRGLSWAAIA